MNGETQAIERFTSMYAAAPPWEIGRPQPCFAQLLAAGAIRGDVLDSGCGTGENALAFAAAGCRVVGIDFVPAAIELAIAKAAERGLNVDFRIGNALELSALNRSFDVVVDSGVFHVFGDVDRAAYVLQIRAALRPGGRAFVVCFSDLEPGQHGPRRVSEAELRHAFGDAHTWSIVRLEPARYGLENRPGMVFSAGGAHAWLLEVAAVS